MTNSIILTGIGTDVGKTVVSTILCKAFQLDYWKPIQTGGIEMRDADTVANLLNQNLRVFPERYLLQAPLSPHEAANKEGISISLTDFSIPQDDNLLIEGAGGLMVPINNQGDLLIDLFQKMNIPIVLVVRYYLGAINHTLLSLEALKQREMSIKGIVFVGEDEFGAEEIITQIAACEVIARIPFSSEITSEFISVQANEISSRKG